MRFSRNGCHEVLPLHAKQSPISTRESLIKGSIEVFSDHKIKIRYHQVENTILSKLRHAEANTSTLPSMSMCTLHLLYEKRDGSEKSS